LNNEVDGGLPADKSRLTDHPCKKIVISFLTTIHIEVMQLTSGKIGAFTDTLFNVSLTFNLLKFSRWWTMLLQHRINI